MKRKLISKMIALAISACLFAECLAAVNPAKVQAGDVTAAAEQSEVLGQGEKEDGSTAGNADADDRDESRTGGDDTGSGEAGGNAQDDTLPGKMQSTGSNEAGAAKNNITAEENKAVAEGASDAQNALSASDVDLQDATISFSEEYTILVELKKISSKVNDDPYDGRYYYSGSTIKPEIDGVCPLTEIEEDKAKELEEDPATKNQVYRTVDKDKKPRFFQKGDKLTENTDYTVQRPSASKAPGRYELKIAAKNTDKYSGTKTVIYEILEKEHKWGSWKTAVAATVLKTGTKQRTCSVCKTTETAVIAKLKPTVKLNMTTVKLKRKQSTTKFKVSGLAKGDSVKSYKSSNKKIFTVNSKGKITAKNKSGKAKLTVTLASGKKATAKVQVQKGTVKTTKVTVNTSRLILLKGGNYTLKTTLTPLTTQQKVKYSSSNKKVATVSSKGVITAKKKGTAKITVKSGSKKKTVNVTVQVKTFAKGDTNGFLNSCKKIANIIMTDGNWIYYSGTGMKKSFAEARDFNPRQTSCANFVNFCMQDFGTLEPGMAFYSNGKGQLIYQGSSSLKAKTKAMVEKNYDIIYLKGVKAVKAGLQPGDICLYKGHTNVFAGLNSEGVPTWYDGGRNATSDGKPESGYFTNMYRTSYLNSLPVYIVLRLKK